MDKLICTDCGEIFDYPSHYVETHNLSTPPYEEWDGCPNCGGPFAKAYRCDCCEEWIKGSYVKLINDERICDNCYITYEPGEE